MAKKDQDGESEEKDLRVEGAPLLDGQIIRKGDFDEADEIGELYHG